LKTIGSLAIAVLLALTGCGSTTNTTATKTVTKTVVKTTPTATAPSGAEPGSGDSAGAGPDPGSGEASGLPSSAVAKAWPDKFCQAKIGMTRAQMRTLMGEPTQEFIADNTPAGFQPQMVWEAYEFHFTAFFDSSDKVRQLDINDIDLSAQQKAALRCDTTRT
jgi:hypothetical protein